MGKAAGILPVGFKVVRSDSREVGQIHTSAKRFARTAEDYNPDGWITARRPDRSGQVGDHSIIEGVTFVRSVEGDASDPVLYVVQDTSAGHDTR
jgi:hypothetical protein